MATIPQQKTGHRLTQGAFWAILESSRRDLRRLCKKLERLSKANLRDFQFKYEKAKRKVNPYYRDVLWKHVSDLEAISEDHADDFSAWVVSLGRSFFERVNKAPKSIRDYLGLFEECENGNRKHRGLQWNDDVDRKEYRGYERPDYVAYAIFQTRFQERLYDIVEVLLRS